MLPLLPPSLPARIAPPVGHVFSITCNSDWQPSRASKANSKGRCSDGAESAGVKTRPKGESAAQDETENIWDVLGRNPLSKEDTQALPDDEEAKVCLVTASATMRTSTPRQKAKPINFTRDMALYPKGSWRGQERQQTHAVLRCLAEGLLEETFFPYALLPLMNVVFFFFQKKKYHRAGKHYVRRVRSSPRIGNIVTITETESIRQKYIT